MNNCKPVLVIGHIDEPSLEVVAMVAETHNLPLLVKRPLRDETLPPVEDIRALIVLGGPQSAYDEAAHPYLVDEKNYIAAAHAADLPTLAICLGSHLAADALGGDAHAGETGLEVGFIDIVAVDDAGEQLQGRFFSFHSDTMQAPPDATVLAISDRYVQAWRLGSVLAIQFHPDLDRDGIETLLGFEGEKLAAFGIDLDALRAELQATDPFRGERLIGDWAISISTKSDPVAG